MEKVKKEDQIRINFQATFLQITRKVESHTEELQVELDFI